MQSMHLLHIALLLVAAGAVAPKSAGKDSATTKVLGQTHTAHRHVAPDLTPDLDPKSHKKFFKKDYPRDDSPGVSKEAIPSHPYPAVQKTQTFANDYVKDDNGDGGKWAAQMDYDVLRQQVKKERVEAVVAEKKKKEEAEELEAAVIKEKKAEAKAAEAEKRAEEAREAAKQAEEKAEKAKVSQETAEHELKAEEKAEKAKQNAEQEKEVKEAKEKVEKEMTDLAACKAELEQARAKLQLALEANEKQHKADSGKLSSAGKSVEEAKSGEQVAKKAKEAAESAEAEVKTEEQKLEKEIAVQKAEHEKAAQALNAQQKKLDQTEADLAAAQERLRGARSEPAEQPKSSASPWSLLLTPLLAAVVSATH